MSTAPAGPGDREIREALERLLASKRFVRAERHSRFLRHVVEETLAGRGAQLKESLLGSEVFGRAVDYDPRVDPVVRVEATKLRGRLEEYYADSGAGEPVVIEFPRGGYVPQFRWRSPAEAPETVPAEESAPPVLQAEPPNRRRILMAAGLAVLAAAATFGGWRLLQTRREPVVAVLPFQEIGPEPTGAASDALAAELRSRLSKSRSLRVVSAASSKAAAHSEQADARAIGRALDADVLVEGALRRQGSQLAVMLQLINAEDGLSFWTGRYECDPSLWDERTLERIAAEVRAALERHRSA